MTANITIKELIQSDIETHGFAWTAKRYSKKMTFTHFHLLAFGYLPRAILITHRGGQFAAMAR